MDYFEAEEAVKANGNYASPDYYRVERSDTIALGLRDSPMQILLDVMIHGSEHSRELLHSAIERGYVKEVPDAESGHTYHDVIDVEDTHGAPYQFKSHIAMQIAFPERYFKFYDGEHVWNYSHPKMQHLLELCMSCLTNSKHPSDYWGYHELPPEEPEKRGPGRPRTKPKEEKKENTGHRAWIEACQSLKQAISDAWAEYLNVCQQRKDAAEQGQAWLKAEKEKLRAQERELERQYKSAMEEWDEKVHMARNKHSNIKNQPKPQREDY